MLFKLYIGLNDTMRNKKEKHRLSAILSVYFLHHYRLRSLTYSDDMLTSVDI